MPPRRLPTPRIHSHCLICGAEVTGNAPARAYDSSSAARKRANRAIRSTRHDARSLVADPPDEDAGPSVREELDGELLADCLHDAAELGYRRLAVSGGEPLLYGGLTRLLARARALGMTTSMTSNGMLITRASWAPLAPLLDLVAISIDGTPAEHDRLRGRVGACARTLANLETVRASGVPFGLIFTLTQHNADSLEAVVRMAAARGARSVQVHPLTLHGRAATALQDSRPDGIELIAARCEAMRLGEELDVAVHVDAVSLDQFVAYRDHFVLRRPVSRLLDVAPVLVVEADGSVMPLTHEVDRGLRLGSLVDERLSSLAGHWLETGTGDVLADACARTWTELTMRGDGPAAYWYDEVAARTRRPPLLA